MSLYEKEQAIKMRSRMKTEQFLKENIINTMHEKIKELLEFKMKQEVINEYGKSQVVWKELIDLMERQSSFNSRLYKLENNIDK